jgi:hypothetical protein
MLELVCYPAITPIMVYNPDDGSVTFLITPMYGIAPAYTVPVLDRGSVNCQSVTQIAAKRKASGNCQMPAAGGHFEAKR